MSASIAGFILRCRDRRATAVFYQTLGLDLLEHAHGGPLHYEMTPYAHDFAGEIYLRSNNFPNDALMLRVDSVEKALDKVRKLLTTELTGIHESEDGRFVYVEDPDGRPVMLLEHKG